MTTPAPPRFDNSYALLPERFFARVNPEPARSPQLIQVNDALALELGLDPAWLASDEGILTVAGNHVPEGADPIATAYAGHQFGGWSAQLGDGRALLLGEVISPAGERFDIQLKGSGRTPYSRGGDGRAPLGPVLREFLVSEAMAALGVPTTRTLSAVTTGDEVYRNGALPGAVLARVARSHIRIGTVQFFSARGDVEGLRLLADHVIQRHYPEVALADNPYMALFAAVVERQAKLMARWQLLGFIHGVMNTDNMLLSGETIDYGPCAFMDHFNPAAVFSSIDHNGRYAYRNQPSIAHWNLARLGQAMLPLLGDDQSLALEQAGAILDEFPQRFSDAHHQELKRKLGLTSDAEEAVQLGIDLFQLMADAACDFTLTFRHLAELANPGTSPRTSHLFQLTDTGANTSHLFQLPETFGPWLARWQQLSGWSGDTTEPRHAAMLLANPIVIPRNHLVEEAIKAAVELADFQPFHQLLDRVTRPFELDTSADRYALPPTPEQVVTATFCGT